MLLAQASALIAGENYMRAGKLIKKALLRLLYVPPIILLLVGYVFSFPSSWYHWNRSRNNPYHLTGVLLEFAGMGLLFLTVFIVEKLESHI